MIVLVDQSLAKKPMGLLADVEQVRFDRDEPCRLDGCDHERSHPARGEAWREYGFSTQPTPAAHGADNPYGWRGGQKRSPEASGGVTLIGVRSDNPTTGRFLITDPVDAWFELVLCP